MQQGFSRLLRALCVKLGRLGCGYDNFAVARLPNLQSCDLNYGPVLYCIPERSPSDTSLGISLDTLG